MCDKDRMAFRIEFLEFLSSTTAKIIELLRDGIVRPMSCLVPNRPTKGWEQNEGARLDSVLQEPYRRIDCRQIKDAVVCIYVIWLQGNCNSSSKIIHNHRIYYNIIGQNLHFVELFSIVRLILTLSHGNASVESGFSVNADMLVENLQSHM